MLCSYSDYSTLNSIKSIAMRFSVFLTCYLLACCWQKSASVPQHLIDEFKKSLMPVLGLTAPPRISSTEKVHIPKTLKSLYRAQDRVEWDTATLPLPGKLTGTANIVRSYSHVESRVDTKFIHQHKKFRLYFNISALPQHEKLKAAEMKLTREAVTDFDSNNPYQRVLIIDIIKPGIKGVRGPLTRLIDSKLIDTRKNSTISVDAYPAVERWISDPSSNYGILIVVDSSKKRQPKKHLRLRRDVETEEEWSQKQPFLFLYTDDGKYKHKTGSELVKMREKRASRKHLRKIERNPCQRQKMYVDFREVGWSDWIVAPLGYHAFYCAGECDYPMPEHLNTTNHAIVQSLMNSVRPMEIPKPCCVPTELSSMSMLYVDSKNTVILKNYKEMVVKGCGCR